MLHFSFDRKLILVMAALLAASAVSVVALTPAASGEIRPLLQSLAIISCSNSKPCQTFSNTSTGAGVAGKSAKGPGGLFTSTSGEGVSAQSSGSFPAALAFSFGAAPGVKGQVLASPNPGIAGVEGVDLSTSIRNMGVLGTSSNGIGVEGTGRIGVAGTSKNNIGVLGTTAFASNGKTFGEAAVEGIDDSTDGGTKDMGVFGFSNFGIGVNAQSTNFVGANAVGGHQVGFDFFPALSVVSNATLSDLIDACDTQNPCDSDHSVFSIQNGGFALFASGAEFMGEVSVGNFGADRLGVGGVTFPSFGSVNISGQYQKNGACVVGCAAATSASAGRAVTTYAPMVSQPTTEDFGEAQLVNGQAYVRLSPDFANVVDQRANYLVFITPEGDANVLYVTQKSPSGFAVRESHAGRSTLMFSYRIVAKPFGSQEARLPMVELPRLHQRGRPTHTRPLHLRA